MKLKSGLRLVGLCGACALTLFQNLRGASTPAVSNASSATASAPDLSREEALKLVMAARKYVAHPQKEPNQVVAEPKVTTPDFDMAEPPPSPRFEAKPEVPVPGQVWVAGHYMPVKGEWRWVRGEWAVPALPISVWIPARYDTKEKKWAPGYWQPDVPSPTAAEPAAKETKPAVAPNGY